MIPSPNWEPRIIAFCCNYCAYAAADLAGSKRMQYPANVRIIHSPCTGKIEMEHILEAFEKGIDGVLVAGCLEGGCHFLEGNLRARKRTDRIREILDEIGVGGERLKMVNLSAAMAPTFVERVKGRRQRFQSDRFRHEATRLVYVTREDRAGDSRNRPHPGADRVRQGQPQDA
jgi:coenzyme F420-reducing hydrogenase delta subunit